MKGTLYLVPSGLGGQDPLLPDMTRSVLARLECFIAENPKNARAFLKAAGYPRPLQGIGIGTLDEHTPESRIAELLSPLEHGIDCGLLSDAGCPAVADPGALLIRKAHAAGIKVVPLVGASALLLALMASGMNGQRFAFWGYLPVERIARAKRLSDLENRSDEEGVTQIFIETPYRNDALLSTILDTCRGDTLLCLATDLTQDTESVLTQRISEWKRACPELKGRPTVFLLYRETTARQKR